MTQIESAELDLCITYWTDQLSLNHWRISWSIVEDSKIPNALMEITPLRVRNHACIFIKESTLLKYVSCTREFQALIVHELIHLILDPIAEEHMLQTTYCVDELRRKENKVRFTRALERAVEHTAVSLMLLSPLYDRRTSLFQRTRK